MGEITLELPDRPRWRSWLEENHETGTVVWLVIFKRSAGKHGLTYQEALDEAICFGWIDSRIKRIDSEKHMVRFTLRKHRSWSLINLKKASDLIDKGMMTPHGRAMLPEDLDHELEEAASRKMQELTIPDDLTKALEDAGLTEQFLAFSPSNRRSYYHWVTQAKRPETRRIRIDRTIELVAKKETPVSMTK